MDLPFFVRGLLIGFAIAAPVGPIGLLCIQRTLSSGRRAGLVSGLGAATADAVYGSLAAFGLTVITQTLVAQQIWLRLGGGLFLCYLGVRALLAKVPENPAGTGGPGLIGAYASTFVLTITNPLTILSFVAIFAGLGLTAAGSGYGRAVLMVVGVFCGSAAWWLTLSIVVGSLRTRIGPAALRWVNRLSGVVILGFGAAALTSAVWPG